MTDLHTAIALGIEHGLADLGGDLSNCTPSMLAHSVIAELRKAGPDLFAAPSNQPCGRVFFPGERLPAGVWFVGEGKHGGVTTPTLSNGGRTVRVSPKVEVFVPTGEQFQAAVARPAEDAKRRAEPTKAEAPQPRGEAACWLEGDDEIFTEVSHGE